MRILMWHVHGSWTTSFLQGPHTCLLPVTADRGPDGRGRARTWDWPATAVEIPFDALIEQDFDVALLQRPEEFDLVRALTGRVPGVDVPAVYVEHNTPDGPAATSRHPMADRPGLRIVHVTPFNDLMWDCGSTPTTVVEHGIVDPGYRYTGSVPRCAVAVNDPVRRGRVTGTDLIPGFAGTAGLDVFGMRASELETATADVRLFEDLPQHELHQEMAERRLYLHLSRWTSLGLSLLEAMHLGLPVVAVGTTEAYAAVPPSAGTVSTSVADLRTAVRRLIADPALAREQGAAARQTALERYGIKRFVADWNRLLEGLSRSEPSAKPMSAN
ncbi:MAG: glycosyltransferase family 4 protein [Catenulisporales bacterium]|nr:glycosyltransferase family 4 protein [Catenulisporales bacterium]